MDPHGRIIDYLRISITDRCNERCLYCMPEGYTGWAQKADHLTAAEVIQVAKAATKLGFQKFRLTGGEPTIRGDLPEIARGISVLPGVEALALSTNGTRLSKFAGPLREAGIDSLNISLDALDPDVYRKVTGSEIAPVLAGIAAARAVGFDRIKLNCVLMRGVNEAEILPLIHFATDRDLVIRFIELMPLSNTEVLNADNFLSVEEVLERLAETETIRPEESACLGWGPARYYHLEKCGATVGFIGAMTDANFCASCNKIRLTADGKIRPCLGRHNEIDLLAALRRGEDPGKILREAIDKKPLDHEFSQCYEPDRPMTAIGG